MLRHPSGLLLCDHCGSLLQRQQNLGPAVLVLLALVGLGGGLAALSLRPHWASLAAPARFSSPPQAPVADPVAASAQPAGLAPGVESTLLQQLAVADQQWVPRVETLPNGATRYHYSRRAGEPQLSIEQLQELVANPPRFDAERLAIGELLTVLATAGVRIDLTPPRKTGAAGEWDPATRTMRIKPQVVQKGSQEFARVLNHEAIHVAQSCRNRGLSSNPLPLGLPSQVPERLDGVLDEPLYRTAPERVRQLEREAYANQHRLDLGAELVRRHC